MTLTVKGDIFALPGAALALKEASPDAKAGSAKAGSAAAAALPAGGATGAAAGAADPMSAPTSAPQGVAGEQGTSSYPTMTAPPTSPPHLTTAPAPAGSTGP